MTGNKEWNIKKKSQEKQGFILFLQNTILEKPQGGSNWTSSPSPPTRNFFRVHNKLMIDKKKLLTKQRSLQREFRISIIQNFIYKRNYIKSSYIFLHDNDCDTSNIDIYVDSLLITFSYMFAWFLRCNHETYCTCKKLRDISNYILWMSRSPSRY